MSSLMLLRCRSWSIRAKLQAVGKFRGYGSLSSGEQVDGALTDAETECSLKIWMSKK